MEESGNNKRCFLKDYKWWYLVGIIVIIVIVIIAGNTIYEHVNKMNDLEAKLNILSEKVEESRKENIIDVNQDILSYMETEMTNYREFIQVEREYLIWILGVVVSGLTILIGFFGWTTSKDVRSSVNKVFNEKAEDIIYERMCDYLKDPNSSESSTRERLEALKNAITRQEQHQKIRVQFLMQEDNIEGSEVLKDAQKLLRRNGLNIKPEQIINFENFCSKSDNEIQQTFKKYFEKSDILIYQVHYTKEIERNQNNKRENESSEVSPVSQEDIEVKPIYQIISELAKEGHYCIFFVPSNYRLKFESSLYCGMTNTGISLVQQIVTLLDC